MLKVNMSGGSCAEGAVHSVDPVSQVIVIENDEEYQLVFPAHIASIDGTISQELSGDDGLEFSADALRKREQISLEAAEQNLANINFNVSEEIQTLYDRLSFLFPCRWAANDIVILDQCIVKPPYCAANIVPNEMCPPAGLARITKVLEGERKKLGL